MGFDPLCGEGAGNAAREAILAVAIIRAARENGGSAGMISHYSSRLLAGFLRHLQTCRQFYASAMTGDWWREELKLLDEGIRWIQERLSRLPPPAYRLVGFDLEPVG